MIQRFGRINRKRTEETIGKFKDIYVVQPPEKDSDARPYEIDVLQKSFDVLPNDKVLEEKTLQNIIDKVYPDARFFNLKYSGAVFENGKWLIRELCHKDKSALLDVLDINSVVCITQSDIEKYKQNAARRMELEIPVNYKTVSYNKLDQLTEGSRPFIVPDIAYSNQKGLLAELAKPVNY